MKALNGYRPTHRNKWRFIQNGILNIQELSLLEFYADIVDFDKNHDDKYGLFEVDFVEISQLFKYCANSVRRWQNKLLLLGFIKKTPKKNWFRLVCHKRYINPGKWGGQAKHYQEIEKNQPIEKILQSFEIDFQTIGEKLQQIGKSKKENNVRTIKTDSIAIGSYKVEYKDSLVSIPSQSSSQRTMADYKKIKEELGFKLLDEEDMKWIDENVKEDLNVPS